MGAAVSDFNASSPACVGESADANGDKSGISVLVISAMPGRVAERILHAIASSWGKKRSFSEWERCLAAPGVSQCIGSVLTNDGRRIFPVTLKIGVREGVFLEDVFRNGARGVSMKPKSDFPIIVLEVPENLSEAGVQHAASQIVAVWVVRRDGWQDSVGEDFKLPYGRPPQPCNRKKRRHGRTEAERRERRREECSFFVRT